MGQYTRRWSDYRNGLMGATLVYDAVDFTNGQQVIDNGPYQFNSSFDENSDFKCDSIDVSASGFHAYRIAYSFTEPEGGTDHPPDGTANPTTAPPRIRWMVGNTTEEVDLDADGLPILNSAGDPFDPPVAKYFGTLFLTITRFENTPFNIANRLTFQNKVNKSNVTFQGLTLSPGQILCLSIEPTSEYTTRDRYLEVAYNFELRADGFKSRRIDQGFRGWINTGFDFAANNTPTELYSGMGSNTARVVLGQQVGQQISRPALLDGTGKPLNTGYKGARGQNYVDLVANPTVPSNMEVISTTFAKFLRHKLYPEIEFGGMGL